MALGDQKKLAAANDDVAMDRSNAYAFRISIRQAHSAEQSSPASVPHTSRREGSGPADEAK